MSYNVFVEQLRYITKVTEMLNSLDGTVESQGSMVLHYIDVKLVQEDSHIVVGRWTNEIGPGAWSFEFVEPKS